MLSRRRCVSHLQIVFSNVRPCSIDMHRPSPCPPLCARQQDAVKSAAGYVQDTVRACLRCSRTRVGTVSLPASEYVSSTGAADDACFLKRTLPNATCDACQRLLQ